MPPPTFRPPPSQVGFGKSKALALRRDLSMSKDMQDPMRANVGFAANMFIDSQL